MIIGQAAGVAAKLAIANHQAVQEIDAAALSALPEEAGSHLSAQPVA